MNTQLLRVCSLTALLVFGWQQSHAQSTAFSYQGRLTDGTNAARGIYDMRFAICDSPAGPNVLGTVTSNGVPVNNGLFTVTLDFGGAAFDGNARWLETGVRSNGTAAAFSVLSPRQPITPTPMTFSNVFNAPPGTKLNFLSFDHTTGRLVSEDTPTVREDSLSPV